MRLPDPSRASRGARALPSIGAVVVVGAVIVGNSWWLSRREAPPEAKSEGERLEALRNDRASAERADRRAEVARLTRAQPAARVEPPIDKLELSEDRVQARPLVPLPLPTERLVRVRGGETLAGALRRVFVYGRTADLVIRAYSRLRKPRRLRIGAYILARLDDPSPMDAESLHTVIVAPPGRRPGVTVERVQRDGAVAYVAREGGTPGTVVRRALRCGVVTSLARSLQRCGHGSALAGMVAAALRPRVSLRSDLRPGDEVRVVFDELVAAGERVRYERVLAVEYRGVRAKMLGIYFDNGHGTADWYAPTGDALEPMFLREPVAGARLTSGFGMRVHPILGVMKMHDGLDFAAPTGTPVHASAAGTFVRVARGPAAGRHIELQHLLGYRTEYLHLSRFARRAKVGKRVRKGQVIGYVGSSGRSTAPHMHYAVKHDGAFIDPVKTFSVPGRGVAVGDRKVFAAHAGRMVKLLRALDHADTGES